MRAKTLRFLCKLMLLPVSAGIAGALDLSDLPTAEREMLSLAAEWEAQFAKDGKPASELQLALSLQALGILQRQAGKPAEALKRLDRSCEIIRRLSPQTLADPAEAKALVMQDLGKLAEAEQLLREIITLRRGAEGDTGLAASLDHLALNLLQQGRYPEVGGLLDEAFGITPENDTAFRATLLAHRARLHHTLGSYAKSVGLLERAFAMDFENPELRLVIRSQMGLSQIRLGKSVEGYSATLAAAEEAKRLYSSRPYLAVPYMNNLGALALSQGDPETADQVFSEAVGTIRSSLGSDHPSLMGPLNNLGVAKQVLGDYRAASAYLRRAADLQKAHLPPVHLRVAETRRNLARNALLSGSADADEAIAQATATGIKLLELLIREGTERERLNFLGRFDLVSLPCATGDAAFIANVLIASKARLFDALLKDSGEERIPEWQDIRASLAKGTVFVDVCRYTTVSETPEARYGAVVICPTGPPQWIPLGGDAELESWLAGFRARMLWRAAEINGQKLPPPALKLRPILRALHGKFWAPVAAAFPAGTTNVAFSPDARTHFLPLAGLLDENDMPLCKTYSQITTVTSARDLLNPAPETSVSGSPWAVFTVSDFPAAGATNAADPLQSLLSELQPLPGTEREAEAIKRIAPSGSEFFHGKNATERALIGLGKAPGVIHMGCHAFFLGTDPSPDDLPLDFDDQSGLLSSGGLVLYKGADRDAGAPLDSDADDLLFPAEIAKLTLGGTRLVTLSACDSGIGTSVSGESLLGIRRGFAIAGAREVLVALWPVSDSATPGFMDRFYRLALASDRPAQALWQAQGEFIPDADSGDESFEIAVLRYAPFILSQNSPLQSGGEITASHPVRSRGWMLAAASIPLLCFLLARFASGRPRVSA